ncbi:hypothetical protein [Acinetobacter gerneri]|uniref:Uncharacterized protein n=1 Tax=Acinetobacter gerneri DSM 14967 = CIP 107464 = MTCC 9824 TaxID=1120926 RepID=N8ZCZ1_9GAMM|nr:hypothetical protein [Acinetobacter gerneri]ENV31534.1 hypothetical protein F960_03895 [Acinetobacter gerneri DSM 14967 = CIP 107464 = MTCC 9824]EPR81899.1 hypothetical protein L289_3397 [Acinetobacter gerneri DSM 14967 = CIP 107464 = MTCC 9824]
MPSLISKIANKISRLYQRAEDFIEEERDFSVSQIFLNATFKRYVTDNVGLLEDLHADLHDDWLRLYATINVKGLHATLSVDLKLIQMEMNKDMQLIVFEQISDTQVVEATFKNIWQKMAAKGFLFFYQKILRRDPLGMILEKFEVITVKDELLYLDLNRWLGKLKSVMDTLTKVHVNHAVLREAELIVSGNVNLMALFNKVDEEDFDDDLEDDVVTPIEQKNEK